MIFPLSDETLLISRCFINAERHQGWMGHHKQKDDSSQTTCIHMLKDSWNFSRTSFRWDYSIPLHTHRPSCLIALILSPSQSHPLSLSFTELKVPCCYSCQVICVCFWTYNCLNVSFWHIFDCLRSGLWIFFSGLVAFLWIFMFIDHITIADYKRIQRAHIWELCKCMTYLLLNCL